MRFGSRDLRTVRLGYVTEMHWPRRPGKTPYKDKARTIVHHVKFQVRRKEGASVIMKWRKSDHYNSRFKSRRPEVPTSEQQELRCKHPDQCKTSLKWHVFDSSKVWNPWLEDFQDDKFIFGLNFICLLYVPAFQAQGRREGMVTKGTHRSHARCHPNTIPQPVKVGHTTGVYVPYSFRTVLCVLLHPTRTYQWIFFWDRTYGFSSLSEKTRKSNRH